MTYLLISLLVFALTFGGALVGLQVAPWIVDKLDSAFMRVVVSLSLVFGLALLGFTTRYDVRLGFIAIVLIATSVGYLLNSA